ncbi:MAG TPA: outer membrane lipoprotein carrier protein LolA [Thermoanaerobaculaceae bacterium]|nr:outer membrane lipoprotein carrier protein LolA [Thermoanaerobaculaceae bacterium]
MTALLLIMIVTLAAAPEQDGLDRLAAALRSAKAWQTEFVQVYTPEGFADGTTDSGRLTLVPPVRLRFDYTSGGPRVFATDGSIGRLVDPAAGSCDAVRLDVGAWGRLPLAAVLDPPAARLVFTVESRGGTLRLLPREPNPELAEITVALNAKGMPESVTVRDTSGNSNRFSFSRWKPVTEPPAAFFQPALPGSPPCSPDQ